MERGASFPCPCLHFFIMPGAPPILLLVLSAVSATSPADEKWLKKSCENNPTFLSLGEIILKHVFCSISECPHPVEPIVVADLITNLLLGSKLFYSDISTNVIVISHLYLTAVLW